MFRVLKMKTLCFVSTCVIAGAAQAQSTPSPDGPLSPSRVFDTPRFTESELDYLKADLLERQTLKANATNRSQAPGFQTSAIQKRHYSEAGINNKIRSTPTGGATTFDSPAFARANPYGELQLNAGYAARAAMTLDSTRLSNGGGAGFLPSLIPVQGQQFYGAGEHGNLQASGSAVTFDLAQIATDEQNALTGLSSHVSLVAPSISSGGSSIAIQQAYGQYRSLVFGISETALADNTALPETLDIAGASGRITVQPGGLGSGQGRLSYYLLNTQDKLSGFTVNVSAEQAVPEIQSSTTAVPATSRSAFARCPDFIGTVKYASGEGTAQDYAETWHLQFGSIARSLALENGAETLKRDVFGWGTTLSGAYRIERPCLSVRDGAFFSVTYGEGIAHYINDLHVGNLASGGNDAVLTAGGSLVALPELAMFVGYTHNWTDHWRSTATYSHVSLDSITAPGQVISPYRRGDYAAINLLYHMTYDSTDASGKKSQHNFYAGFEGLYGRLETLDGRTGGAERLLFVVAVTK